MKKRLVLLAVIWLLNDLIVYHYGLRDGEQQYKASHRMYMALKSAYHFGYMDAHEGRREDWDGPDL